MVRQIKNIPLKFKCSVLGDGQTEQYYLKHLKKIKGYNYSVYPSLFQNITIENAENKIDELRSGGCDLIIFFTDFDTIINQNKIEKFEELVRKYSNHSEVLICESMPSIEFWFLIHYKKTTREFINSDEVCRELVKYIDSFTKKKSFLNCTKWVKQLCSDGIFTNAIKNAKEILNQKEKNDVGNHFPFTKAHIGIQKFEKIKENENKQKC